MKPQRDYTAYSFYLSISLIVVLVGLSLLPAQRIGGFYIKRVNILSDLGLLPREVEGATSAQEETLLDTTLLAQAELEAMAPDHAQFPSLEGSDRQITQRWEVSKHNANPPRLRTMLEVEVDQGVGDPVSIEDFGINAPAMAAFYHACENPHSDRPLRIAVLGDSFIEGDIFTADLREQLQHQRGGAGVGFVPFATSMASLRATVSHRYSGWNNLTLHDRGSLSEGLRNKYFVSGVINIPTEGATTRIEGSNFRNYLATVGSARLIFLNRGKTQIEVLLNDSISHTFHPEASENVQQIIITAPISKLKVSLSQIEGFVGYGIILEDPQGVSVDNFSIRGNSGLSLFETNRQINTQVGELAGYDLVILQYGLNAMSADVLAYTYYRDKLANMIRYIRQCFPTSSIMVMGIGDRNSQRGGEFVTMRAVPGMIKAQREAAQEAGVAFWNTFEAMGGENSMATFVKNRWAAQDYTHLRHPGGKVIAAQLIRSFAMGAVHDNARIEARERAQRVPIYQIDLNLESIVNPELNDTLYTK